MICSSTARLILRADLLFLTGEVTTEAVLDLGAPDHFTEGYRDGVLTAASQLRGKGRGFDQERSAGSTAEA